jgi:bacterioferritin-associated ferredoxin
VTLIEKLRLHAGIPYEYGYATLGVTVAEARALVDTDDLLRSRIAKRDKEIGELRAELAAATRRCADCHRTARDLTEWHEPDGTVVWLGPSCRRRRGEDGQADALPIGPSS